jgi:F-type H+-transporting ATPase subunit b
MAAALITPVASSGSFLISPNVGLMVWTLLLFVLSMAILAKWVFPRITEALDRRQRAIEDSIEAAERVRHEADELLAEYRERLTEARRQAEDIIERARRAGEAHEQESVADLTVMATEKVTRKVLNEQDQQRLVEEALRDLDFSALTAGGDE